MPRGRSAWYRFFVAAPTLKELLAFDVETRLTLVQELWDSIVKDAQSGSELAISEAERLELDDRLREDDEDPEGAIPWPEARARLRNRE
jgi:putative addiction module component (TIGR02574 family)